MPRRKPRPPSPQPPAVAEKVADYFRERAGRADIGRAKRILKRVGRGKAPVAGDEL